MRELVTKLYTLLSSRDRKKLFFLIFVIISSSFMGVTGIASIMPFVSILSNPQTVHSNKYLLWFYENLGFSDVNTYILYAGVALLFVFLLSNLFLSFTVWFNLRFVRFVSYNLTRRLLYKYLSKPYEFFLRRNTADLTKNLFSEINLVVTGVIRPATESMAQGVLAISILVFLIIVNPLLALMAFGLMGGMYVVIFISIRRKLIRIGKGRVKRNKQRFTIASEALGGIKDVKLLGREKIYLERFSVHARRYEIYMATTKILSKLPKYIMEFVAFGGMLIVALYLFATNNKIDNILPIMALYAFAGYRLMPALQEVFRGFTEVRGNMSSVDVLYNDLKDTRLDKEKISTDVIEPLKFESSISMKNVQFTYEGTSTPVISDIDIEIKSNTTVGFVGTTGCGKTTAVDIILGLLIPQEGQIVVDGVPVTRENLRNWQRNLGYVAQYIYLADDTITRNIAFGVPDEEIDMESVIRAAEIANIHDFIENNMKDGYETVVGERGVRISGGQRQRIGIARALYNDPSLLVLDEATSALDNVTEHAVMEAIDTLARKKTIILIAHRISTVKKCDVIYLLDKGKIIASGSYEDLIASSEEFRTIATRS